MARVPVLAVLITCVLAGSAHAATTISPDRFDDPLAATSCAAGHPAGSCSLRAAVALAANGDTIALGAGTYTLAHGELLVSTNVAFTAAGPAATTIQQTTAGSRVLEFAVGTTASMRDLTITGGDIVGAAGTDGTVPSPNGTSGGGAYGAGIYSRGTLTLTLVDLVANHATGGKGGDGHTTAAAGGTGGDGGYASGSAISFSGHLTLDRVTAADNTAHGAPGGKGANGSGANAGGVGGKGGSGSGAIVGGLTTVLAVRDSTISGNTAFAAIGGAGGNGGVTSGHGGAGGRSIRGAGGGIFSNGSVTLVNTTISGNELHGGDGGKGGGGGGVAGVGGDGGYAEGGDSGGIALFNGASGKFASVTIVGNGAFVGSGGQGGSGATSGATGVTGTANGGNYDVYSATLEIRDSVIAAGVGSPSSANCSVGGGATVTSAGFNVEDRNQCVPVPAGGDRHDLDPKLGPLQDNGGPAETIAPLAGSPVIDGGHSSCSDPANAPLTADQRGAPRGTPCDNGAYEAIAPSALSPPAIAGTPRSGELLTCTAGAFGGDDPLTIDTAWLRDGQPAGAGGQYAVPDADVGHAITCRMTATNAYGAAAAGSAAVSIAARQQPPGGSTITLSKLRIRPKKLHRRTHAKVTFALTAASKVRFSLCRRAAKRCKRLKKGAPKAVDGKAGTNTVALRFKLLKPGRYRLTATPDGGKAAKVSFRLRP